MVRSGSNISVEFITTGGTLSMGKNDAGKYVPVYDIRHFALAMEIDRLAKDGITPESGQKKSLGRDVKEDLLGKLVATKRAASEKNNTELNKQLMEIVTEINRFTGQPNTLEEIVQRHGFDTAAMGVSLFLIDSINFSTEDHQKELHAEIERKFSEAEAKGKKASVIILGGTDSEQWYATLEARDMHRRGWFENGHKLVFTSSMHSFEDNPTHVARVIKGAKRVARNKAVPGGAYAVSARQEEASRVAAYDVLRGFIKISSGTNAFEGTQMGTSTSDFPFEFNIGYNRLYIDGSERVLDLPEKPYTGETQYANIAPPILSGSSTSEIIALLAAYGNAEKPFDAIIIEGLPGVSGEVTNHPQDLEQIRDLVSQITANGTKVIINNNRIYNEGFERQKDNPVLVNEIGERWENAQQEGGFLSRLQEAGRDNVITSTETPNDAYNTALLEYSGVGTREYGVLLNNVGTELPDIVTLGIRYTPHVESFQQGVKLAVEILRARTPEESPEGFKPTLVISGLPGNCISSAHAQFLKSVVEENGIKIRVAFDYNGKKRNGVTEGSEANEYDAAGASAAYAKPTANNPQQEMALVRAKFKSRGTFLQ